MAALRVCLACIDTLGGVSRLIVNADDFGYTDGVNRAVTALFRGQALRSTTAMATGGALPGSASAIPAGLGVGCHVVLVDGRPAGAPGEIASLLSGAGNFRPALGRFVVDLHLGRLGERAIEVEAVAQIRALQAKGFAVTHVDTHKHTHLFPRVLRPLLRAARACGVLAVRNPFEPEWAQAATAGAPRMRRMQMRLPAGLRSGFLREVERAGMCTTDGALGMLATGVLQGQVLERLLAALERHAGADACYELVCHPAVHDAELDAQKTRLKAERAVEFAALLEAVPRWTGPGGVHRLVGFAEL